MIPHNSKILAHIESSLRAYEDGALSLEGLQANVEAEMGALEGPGVSEVVKELKRFVNLIESSIYSSRESGRVKAAKAITHLREEIARYR